MNTGDPAPEISAAPPPTPPPVSLRPSTALTSTVVNATAASESRAGDTAAEEEQEAASGAEIGGAAAMEREMRRQTRSIFACVSPEEEARRFKALMEGMCRHEGGSGLLAVSSLASHTLWRPVAPVWQRT